MKPQLGGGVLCCAEAFGDASLAKYVLVVSHPWITPTHPDPDCIHMEAIIQSVERDLFQSCRWLDNVYQQWCRYYYFGFEEDVLVFFDFASLPQWVRTLEVVLGFR